VLTVGYGWLLWMDVWVDLRFCTRFKPDLLYLLLCSPVFVSFTLLSIKKIKIKKIIKKALYYLKACYRRYLTFYTSNSIFT